MYRGVWEQARFLIPVLVSAGFFISLTTLMHLDRFTPGLKLMYWLLVYIGAPLLALALYVYYERRGANWTVSEPVTPLTRKTALVTGAIVLLAGVGLFLAPETVIAYWPWSVLVLMLRIFAAWFSAFGVGLLWFWLDHDWSRLHYMASLMMAASVLDLMMVLHRDDVKPDSLSVWVYAFHLALFGLVGGLMHRWQRRARAASGI